VWNSLEEAELAMALGDHLPGVRHIVWTLPPHSIPVIPGKVIVVNLGIAAGGSVGRNNSLVAD
jgi:hypothetical protein